MWNKIKNLWLDITTEEFQLTVWFPGTTKIDGDGNKEVSKDPVQWKGMDGTLQDAIMNKYFGIAELYQIKFEKLFSTFEDVTKEYHNAQRGTENKPYYPTLDELEKFYGADE